MKMKIRIIFILVTVLTISSGCTNDNNLISMKDVNPRLNLTDIIEISTAEDSFDLTTKSKIKQLVDKVIHLKGKKLSKDQEKNVFTKVHILYTLNLRNKDELVGLVMISSRQELIFFDVKSMTSNKRSISYINIEKEKINEIINIIPKLQ